jgi:hypothetical protein
VTMQEALRNWFRATKKTPEQAINALLGFMGIQAVVECDMTREELLDVWAAEEMIGPVLGRAALKSVPDPTATVVQQDDDAGGGDAAAGKVVDIRTRKGNDDG